jgi:3-oxoacyl-[acyl-carrier protein] reductase
MSACLYTSSPVTDCVDLHPDSPAGCTMADAASATTPTVPLPPWLSLARGCVVLVTGAGSPDGIGFATARALGELAAAAVHITSTTARIHERAAELRACGIPAVGHIADLTSETQVASLVADILAASSGRLDVLVNNAGMVVVTAATESTLPSSSSSSSTSSTATWDTSTTTAADVGAFPGAAGDVQPAAWRGALARNLDTAYLVTRACLPALLRTAPTAGARIINVSSVTGPVAAMRGFAAYAAAKAGMVGLTRAIAVDYAARGITCNAVLPGWIHTASSGDDEIAQGAVCPVRRCGSPAEVAAAIAWLATPGAAYVTGQCIVVDGGNTIAEERALLPGP